jgi:hypothetical protein
LEEKVAAPVQETDIIAVGIRHADHSTPLYPQNSALISATIGGRTVSIVRSRTKGTELLQCFLFAFHNDVAIKVRM